MGIQEGSARGRAYLTKRNAGQDEFNSLLRVRSLTLQSRETGRAADVPDSRESGYERESGYVSEATHPVLPEAAAQIHVATYSPSR